MIPPIIVTVIDPPPPSPRVSNAAIALAAEGAHQALRRCGPWPTSGTIDDYYRAMTIARLEVCHISRLAQRYKQRYGIDVEDSDLEPKWLARRETTVLLMEQRAECIARLTEEPVPGSA
jgi:hypothetical protein